MHCFNQWNSSLRLSQNLIGYLEKPEWGIRERNEGNDGNVGNQGGNAGNQGGNAGNQGGNDGNHSGNVGNARNQDLNEGNKGENLRIGVELINYNRGEGQETRNCTFCENS